MASTLDSRSLEVFLAVCDAGSMTAAARRLGVTQGAVSQQILRLESGLALQLILRERRELRLTPAGLQLRHHARKVLEDLHETERAMKRFSGLSYPHLSVRIMDTLGKVLGATVIEALRPVAERIELSAGVTGRHREEMISGAADILITARAFEDRLFEVHPIAREPLVLMAPRGVLDPSDVDLDRLGGELPLIRIGHQRRLGRMAEDYLDRQLVIVQRSVDIQQTALVIEAVRQGQGWAIITPFGLLDGIFAPGEIDVLPLPGEAPCREIVLVARRDAFADLPEKLAAACRRRLQEEIDRRLSLVAELVLPLIRIKG